MTLNEYQACLAAVPYGKRLPTAIYLHREGLVGVAPALDQLASRLADRYQIGPEFNVLKFRSNELKVSFLSYPRFFEHPHPALRQAVTVDLVRGKARRTDYADNPKPPILHRKEAFLPVDHPKRRLFTALAEAEEAAGLYADTTTIGFKLNWEQLVASTGSHVPGKRPAGVAAAVVPPEWLALSNRHEPRAVRRHVIWEWVKRSGRWPDHLLDCEITQIA